MWGLVSANQAADRLMKAGLHTIKNEFADAPLSTNFRGTGMQAPRVNGDGNLIGQIVNVRAMEAFWIETVKLTHANCRLSSLTRCVYLKTAERVGN